MSDRIKIKFDDDMPAASVEVVAPDLQTIRRLWIDSGQISDEIDVPSENSFLRVNFASGKSLVLRQPGQGVRHVSMKELQAQITPSRSMEESMGLEGVPQTDTLIGMEHGIEIKLASEDLVVTGMGGGRWASYQFFPDADEHAIDAFDLTAGGDGWKLSARLPSRLRVVHIQLRDDDRRGVTLEINVATESPNADALSGYMARGDYYSAEAMTNWVDHAEGILYAKRRDPTAATIGGYLLLRLRRFDLMRNWAKNLADLWPNLADGSIIWAWQQIHQRGDEEEIKSYLGKAAKAKPPVFSQGLKLLMEGLRLISAGSREPLGDLEKRLGIVQWDSPFTAGVTMSGSNPDVPRFDLRYEAAVVTRSGAG